MARYIEGEIRGSTQTFEWPLQEAGWKVEDHVEALLRLDGG